MMLVSILLIAFGILASNALPQDSVTDAPPKNPRCSKTLKRLYGPSGDGENYLGDYSWMVALGYQEKDTPNIIFRCGGILITNQWILTAAQCVTGLGNSELVKTRVADLNLNPDVYDGVNPFDGVIDEIKVHPGYKVDSLAKDIALIRLKEPVPSSHYEIHPLCILSDAELVKSDFYKGKFGFILGWGVYVVGGGLSQKLLEGTVNVVEPEQCKEKYAALSKNSDTAESKYANVDINDEILCAGNTDQAACDGDVGGPIVFIDPKDQRHYLGGIISGIYKCGAGYPNLFTKVAAFTSWINEVTGENFA